MGAGMDMMPVWLLRFRNDACDQRQLEPVQRVCGPVVDHSQYARVAQEQFPIDAAGRGIAVPGGEHVFVQQRADAGRAAAKALTAASASASTARRLACQPCRIAGSAGLRQQRVQRRVQCVMT